MRKITFLMVVMAVLLTTKAVAATTIKSSTAWFNGETFESFTAPYNLTAALTDPTQGFQYSNWTTAGCFAGIQNGVASTTATATGNVFGFPAITPYDATAIAFSNYPTGSTSGTKTASKTFTTLTGYVYIKTAFYANTYPTSYILRNNAGQDVFAFSSLQATGNDFYTTGVPAATWAIGARANWGDIEAVLDLNGTNKIAKKITFTYNAVSKSQTDIALTNGTDISVLAGSISRSAGLDNTTIAQLMPDNIQNITSSQTIHQTGDGVVNTTLGVTAISTAMGLTLPFSGANTDLDIQWSIADWGMLTSQADKDKVSITRGTTDNTTATLATSGAISTDADITVMATLYGGALLTKTISLKSSSIDGVKSTLLSEITSATSTKNAVTASNPYLNKLKSTLNTVIIAGQSAYDNAASTIPEVVTATTNLLSAKSAFTTGVVPFTTYVGYIDNTVKVGRDSVGINYPGIPFFTTIKNTLNTAISIAEAAKDTVSSVAAITNATNALVVAYGTFNTDRPSYYSLGTQIATSTNRYTLVLPRQGDSKFLQFPTANVSTLADAISVGNLALSIAETPTEVTSATSTLTTALSTFNSASRVAPTTNYYRIFTYGASGGDGSDVKKMLYIHNTDTLKTDTIPSWTLVWSSIADAKTLALGDSALWKITTGSATNKYIIQNKATGLYMNGGTGFSKTAVEYSLNEVKSQNAFVNGFIDWTKRQYADPNFIYAIVNGSNLALEVRTLDTPPYGSLRTAGVADRYRFAFQFEEQVAPSVSTAETTLDAFSATVGATATKTLTLAGDNLFGANINLSISGTNADAFSVSTSTISPINTYVRNNALTVTYSPLTAGQHTAKLSIAVDGGNTLEYNLSGSTATALANNHDLSKVIYVANGNIQFQAGAGERVEVYNAIGIKLAERNSVEGLNSISIPAKGVMMVKVGNRTAKVVL